jgi:hypothetical protein
MVDLPQHVASIMVIDGVLFGEYAYGQMFEFNWFRPYWFGYFAIWAVSYLTGLVWAAKIVVAASVVGLVLSLALLRKEVHAPAIVDWLFLVVAFGFAYEWGFLNFLVCAPLGPLFLIQYHRFLQGRVSPFTISAWIVLLFFGHLLVMAFFCVAGSCMALRGLERGELSFGLLVKRILPMTVSIPIGLAWVWFNVEPRNVENAVQWGLGMHRLLNFFPDLFSLDYDATQIAVAVLLVLLPFGLGVRPKWSAATIAPVAFYSLFMMLVPSLIWDNLGTYQRFQIFGLMFYTLMLEDADVVQHHFLPRVESLVVALPAIVGLALLGRVTLKAYGYEQESKEFRQVLELTKPGARALGMVQEQDGQFSRVPVYLHYPVWYQVEKRGLVDFNFAQWTSLNSYYKEEHRSRVGPHFAWYPDKFDWDKHGADIYRYFIVRGTPEFASYVFRDDAEKVSLKYHGQHWLLFESVAAQETR